MLRLKTMRTQAGISQAQFAKDMGVAQNTVSNWENENRTLDADIKFALFQGSGPVTDEMYAEVKRFAQFIQARQKEEE